MQKNPLPILRSLSGNMITNTEDWERFRRPELMALLETFAYGRRPYEKPDVLTFTETFSAPSYMGTDALYREVTVRVNDHRFPIYVFIPQSAPRPVPAFVCVMNELRGLKYNFRETLDYPHLPVRDIVARGYALAVMPTNAVSPDWMFYSEFKKGVFHAMEPDASRRTDASWATLSGWAFGASRVLDYLETDPEIDSTRVAVVGHSRDGKTALWAGATDPRFRLVISNCSGCGGAAFTRDKKGEHIKNITISDWFCGNYNRYIEREEMMPFDQHMLLAAIAPRPLYVKSCIEDEWADPDAELYAAREASPAYELYGLDGVIAPEKPEIDKVYHEGMIAYHCSHGDHSMTTFDWHCYMDFADKRL